MKGQKDLKITLDLSSINFDINKGTVSEHTPFTSEMTFDLKLVYDDKIPLTLEELIGLIDQHGYPSSGAQGPADKLQYMFEHWILTDANLSLAFRLFDDPDVSMPQYNSGRKITTSIEVLNNLDKDIYATSFSGKLKFVTKIDQDANYSQNGGDNYNVLLYPCLELLNAPPADSKMLGVEESLSFVDPTGKKFNKELKQSYEVFYAAPDTSTREVIDRSAEDLVDSINDLNNSLGKNLGKTFKTRLQPVGVAGTPDLALWVIIKKATDELSFHNFEEYMKEVFCGKGGATSAQRFRQTAQSLNRRRGQPFIHVDSYRAVKIAAEAFTLVNCMIQEDFSQAQVDDLLARVPITDGNFDPDGLQQWWENYKVEVNIGARGQGDGLKIIPYLAVIRDKLKDEQIKDKSFDAAFEHYLNKTNLNTDSCYGLARQKLAFPCFMELIWSYWHEESMMVQGLKAIYRRFQNIESHDGSRALSGLAIDPLRDLSNILWGRIQDEQHQLSVLRRAHAYEYAYGFSLQGAAVKNMRAAERNIKFIEAFHRLLHLVAQFYKDSDDMTKRPDAFPVLNGLKEVHLILSEYNHNETGHMTIVSRTEMLTEQWILARPEFREFLPSRIMVAYPEGWMDRVASLNKLMGWTTTSPLHFRDLGRFGEQILLSVRFGNWSDINNRNAAFNWANFWREQIQGYIHAYRIVTGVDLTNPNEAGSKIGQPPSVHLTKRVRSRQMSRKAVRTKSARKQNGVMPKRQP